MNTWFLEICNLFQLRIGSQYPTLYKRGRNRKSPKTDSDDKRDDRQIQAGRKHDKTHELQRDRKLHGQIDGW